VRVAGVVASSQEEIAVCSPKLRLTDPLASPLEIVSVQNWFDAVIGTVVAEATEVRLHDASGHELVGEASRGVFVAFGVPDRIRTAEILAGTQVLMTCRLEFLFCVT
jgi:hypothetical protein